MKEVTSLCYTLSGMANYKKNTKPTGKNIAHASTASNRKTWVLLGAALIAAYLFWPSDSLPDPRIPVTYVTAAEIKASPFILVDARSKAEFAAGHATRAINVTIEDMTKPVFFWPSNGQMRVLAEFIEGYNVIVYGDTDRSFETESVARALKLESIKNVKVFRGKFQDIPAFQ